MHPSWTACMCAAAPPRGTPPAGARPRAARRVCGSWAEAAAPTSPPPAPRRRPGLQPAGAARSRRARDGLRGRGRGR
eukprot:365625-Chlamydomonas_euryale.AAC.12